MPPTAAGPSGAFLQLQFSADYTIICSDLISDRDRRYCIWQFLNVGDLFKLVSGPAPNHDSRRETDIQSFRHARTARPFLIGTHHRPLSIRGYIPRSSQARGRFEANALPYSHDCLCGLENSPPSNQFVMSRASHHGRNATTEALSKPHMPHSALRVKSTFERGNWFADTGIDPWSGAAQCPME